MALQDVAITAASFAGVATSLTVLAKFGPTKWLFSRLIVSPATEWLHRGVHDAIEPVRQENKRDHAEVRSALGELGGKVDCLGNQVDGLTKRFDNTAEVLDEELGIEV